MDSKIYNNFIGSSNTATAKKQIKARVIEVNSENTKALVETIDNELRVLLYNKTGELLKVGDYVVVEYTKLLSEKNAYISFRNGAPRFLASMEVVTQEEYDLRLSSGNIIDKLYVIIGGNA